METQKALVTHAYIIGWLGVKALEAGIVALLLFM